MSRSRYTVRLTAAADRDVDEILDYAIQTQGPIDAAKLLGQLLDKVKSLTQFPDRGSIPVELAAIGEQGHRQLIFQQYRIIYHRVDDLVFVILIADGRRDMMTLLDQRLMSD